MDADTCKPRWRGTAQVKMTHDILGSALTVGPGSSRSIWGHVQGLVYNKTESDQISGRPSWTWAALSPSQLSPWPSKSLLSHPAH